MLVTLKLIKSWENESDSFERQTIDGRSTIKNDGALGEEIEIELLSFISFKFFMFHSCSCFIRTLINNVLHVQ